MAHETEFVVGIRNPRKVLKACLLGFEVDLIGPNEKKQERVVEFPVIASQQFGKGVRAEVSAFVLTKEQNSAYDL